MSDKKHKRIERLAKKDARLAELETMLFDTKSMDAGEYLTMLYEIRHRATIRLNMAAVQGETFGAETWMKLTDKTHFLIDTMQPQKVALEPVANNPRYLGWNEIADEPQTDA